MRERTQAVIPLVRKPKFLGRYDTYTLVITDSRMVFAQLTGDMLKECIKEVQQKGKEEGKGFFSRWVDQMRASMNYAERYWNITAEEALWENPNNFAIANASVSKIRVSRKSTSSGSDDPGRNYTELKIESSSGKYKYRCDGNAGPIRDALKQVFGDIVKK